MKYTHRYQKFLLAAAACALWGCSEEQKDPEEVIRVLGTCGNGVLDAAEVCDGSAIREGAFAVCPDGKAADMSKVTCSDKCDFNVEAACPTSDTDVEKCGNGKLDAGEVCDGGLFADGVRVCPEDRAPLASPVFRCTTSCTIDTTLACSDNPCGNGKLDAGEACDGTKFDSASVSALKCGEGKRILESALKCTDACAIDASTACIGERFVVISEFIPALVVTSNSVDLDGFAFELTNMDHDAAADLSTCSLYAVSSDGKSEVSWQLADYGLMMLDPRDPQVVCILNEGKDSFPEACDYTINVQNFIKTYSNKVLLALKCGEDYVDIINLNSVNAAINAFGVDFVRKCDALPVTEVANAKLGEGWTIYPESNKGPNYGLGEHCPSLSLASCTYTADSTTLNSRSQKLTLTLDVNIPGLSDLSDHTDVSNALMFEYLSGKLGKDGKTVSYEVHHRPSGEADMTWTNKDGIDRYVAIQHNWDMYEGYWTSETGTYVLDAGISFDNGSTWTICGPNGIIADNIDLEKDPAPAYNAASRNTLVVDYGAYECGNGVLEPAEICDTTQYIDEVLVCSDPAQVPVNMSKASCLGCNSVSVEAACALAPVTCGNGKLDLEAGELCDGSLFDEATLATKCRKGYNYVPGRLSCDKACAASYKASCIVDGYDLAIDEFIIKYDETTNAPAAMAFAIRPMQTDAIDANACNLWLMDTSNKAINTYSMASIVTGSDAGSSEVFMNSCKPVVICSEPYKANEEDYIFPTSMCDARIFMQDASSASGYIDMIGLKDRISQLQISCSGDYVDHFDFTGLKNAMAQGYSHGKLVDDHAWPERATCALNKRMTLDKTYDLSSFAVGVCGD